MNGCTTEGRIQDMVAGGMSTAGLGVSFNFGKCAKKNYSFPQALLRSLFSFSRSGGAGCCPWRRGVGGRPPLQPVPWICVVPSTCARHLDLSFTSYVAGAERTLVGASLPRRVSRIARRSHAVLWTAPSHGKNRDADPEGSRIVGGPPTGPDCNFEIDVNLSNARISCCQNSEEVAGLMPSGSNSEICTYTRARNRQFVLVVLSLAG